NENTFQIHNGEIFSSKLPSDPGLKILVSQATVEEKTVTPRTLFGGPVIDPRTKQQAVEKESIVKANDVIFEIEEGPFFSLPYVTGNARDPLGPFESFNFGANRVFGAQFGVGLDVYQLLGAQAYEGTKWRLNLDYLSRRGPGIGTDFDYSGKLWP